MGNDDILKEFLKSRSNQKESVRLLKNIDDVQAWSNVPKYMVSLLTQLKFLNDIIDEPKNMIEEMIIKRYLEFCLSREGFARVQFVDAHKSIMDQNLRGLMTGLNPEEQKGGLER